MSKLVKCKSCGNLIAKDASICPQCGGKVKKSHGCVLLFVLLFLIIIGACIAGSNGGSSTSVNTNPDSASPENADPYQVDHFSNDGAMICAQNFLESKISKDLKYITAAKVEKLSASGKEKVSSSVNPDNLWIVHQEFTERNALGVDLKHSYIATIEFAKGKGYRVVILTVDDVVIFPTRK